MNRRPWRVISACLACLVGSAIWASTSSAQWSATFDVNTTFTGDEPGVAFDPFGNAFVWWTGGTISSIAVAPPEQAFGDAFRPSDPGRSILKIDLDFDAAGNAVVVWVNDLNQLKAARRSPGSSGTFGPAQTVSSGVDQLQLDVNPQGAALLTWVGPGVDKVSAAYSAPGAASAAPTFATQQIADQNSQASTPFGVLDPGTAPSAAVIWTGDAVPTQATTTNASAPSPFGTPAPVDTNGGGISAAGNDAGNAVAIWRTEPGGGELPPSVSVRGPSGGFGPPTGLPSDPVSQHAAAMGAGGLGAVAWSEQENDPTPPTCAVGTLSILAAQNPFGTTTQASEETYNTVEPGIAVSPGGAVLVGWRNSDCQTMAANVRGLQARLGTGPIHTFFQGNGQANDGHDFAAAFDCSGNALAVWAQGNSSNSSTYIRGARYTAVSPPGCAPSGGEPGGGGPGGGEPGGGGSGGGGGGGASADDPACEDAEAKLDKAKDKLKKLRQDHAAKAKLKKAKKKVKKAKEAVEEEC